MIKKQYSKGWIWHALVLAACAIETFAAGSSLATLKGRVMDATTGHPVVCTVQITDSQGNVLTERDSFRSGFRCPGQFEKRLPAGQTRILITRGFETKPLEKDFLLEPGVTVAAEFKLERLVDLRQRGWYAGDSHAHMIHGEKTIPVDFDFVALSAQAEDLQYLSLSHAWEMENPTPERLQAELDKLSTPDCALRWNLEAPKNYYQGDAGRCLGHCWSIGMRGRTRDGQNVIDLLLAASAGDYQSQKPSFANFESHQLIHAQGGAVFYTHPLRWWTGAWGGQGGYAKQEKMRISNMAVELPLDTLLGPTYDGLDVLTSSGELSANDKAFRLWRLLQNHGYRVAATGSSDACFDRPGGAVPGSARTYTCLTEDFSLAAVAKATAQGRTFATTGPLLLASLNGHPPGSSFPANGQSNKLQIELWSAASGSEKLQRFEIWRNGKRVHQMKLDPSTEHWESSYPIQETNSAWYCARVFAGKGNRQQAISGAFYFEVDEYRPPVPVPVKANVRVLDAITGKPLTATVTETTYFGPIAEKGALHSIRNGQSILNIPGQARLLAEAPGYVPLEKSPILDNPSLVKKVTELNDQDLLEWETYEEIRRLLSEVSLTFRLKPMQD